MITSQEKIRAFVEGRTWQIMSEQGETDIQGFWKDVSLADIKRYVDEHGVPETFCFHEPDTADGEYLVRSDSRWSVYSQERGIKSDEKTYATRSEALDALIESKAASLGITA